MVKKILFTPIFLVTYEKHYPSGKKLEVEIVIGTLMGLNGKYSLKDEKKCNWWYFFDIR